MQTLASILIFMAAYIAIATEKISKTAGAVLGASLMIMLHLVSFEEAVLAVDLNVIFLLVGMMTCVHILSKTGFFEWVAISVAKIARGKPIMIMFLLLIVTAVLSAFFDNVTTIILLAPLTILIAELLEINPVPFLILETIASNIGGTATLIGDPPNIIIGSQAKLSFTDFLVNLGPVVMIILIVFIITVYVIFRGRFEVKKEVRERVINAIPHLAIVDSKNMVKSLSIIGLVFAGFFLQGVLRIEPGIIALAGSMLMILFCKSDSDETLMKVEWGVIFFFIGMFMMIAGLEANGVITKAGESILMLTGKNLFAICLVVLFGSAMFSAVLDNIPFVITMIPLVKNFIIHFALSMGVTDPAIIQTQIAQPLWWSLALGACLGGNATIIGASANVVMVRISGRNKYPISFTSFLSYGVPFTLQALVISGCYIWWRYFLLQ
ncbi:MAG: ArsB/NhaD family transporter [Candidatus Omnitrophica bacterium]|nr:ArsB/NhaD family transporter [Candidatus Omnitrophota bacterium]